MLYSERLRTRIEGSYGLRVLSEKTSLNLDLYAHDLSELLLEEKNCAVRTNAAIALGNILKSANRVDRNTLLALREAFIGGDTLTKAACAYAVGKIGKAASELTGILIYALGNCGPAVSLKASEALVTMQSAKAIKALANALEDPVPEIRFNASRALLLMRHKKEIGEHVEAIVNALFCYDEQVSENAEKILESIGKPALPKLLNACKNRRFEHERISGLIARIIRSEPISNGAKKIPVNPAGVEKTALRRVA